MNFYIIIGHMGNKIQILLDIDECFSFFFQKTQIYFLFFIFLKKKFELFFLKKNYPPPRKKHVHMYADNAEQSSIDHK
jgi:hypothetical protein